MQKISFKEVSKLMTSELHFLERILPPITYNQIRKNVMQNSFEFVHLKTKELFSQFISESKEEKSSHSSIKKKNYCSFLNLFFKDYIMELKSIYNISDDAQNLFCELIFTYYGSLPNNFNAVMKEFNKEYYEINDLEIEYSLKKRNIPFHLSKDEERFYFLSSNINNSIIKQYNTIENNEEEIYDDEFLEENEEEEILINANLNNMSMKDS